MYFPFSYLLEYMVSCVRAGRNRLEHHIPYFASETALYLSILKCIPHRRTESISLVAESCCEAPPLVFFHALEFSATPLNTVLLCLQRRLRPLSTSLSLLRKPLLHEKLRWLGKHSGGAALLPGSCGRHADQNCGALSRANVRGACLMIP